MSIDREGETMQGNVDVPEEERRRGCPSAEEIAEHRARGEVLTWVDGRPEWVVPEAHPSPQVRPERRPAEDVLDYLRRTWDLAL